MISLIVTDGNPGHLIMCVSVCVCFFRGDVCGCEWVCVCVVTWFRYLLTAGVRFQGWDGSVLIILVA